MEEQLSIPRSTNAPADLLEENIFSIGWDKRKEREMVERGGRRRDTQGGVESESR